MNPPSHDEISERAYRLWQQSGSDDAVQNWLEAERQLSAKAPNINPSHQPAAGGKTVSESRSAAAVNEREAQQKKEAREPKVANHTAPRAVPPESGKPLWNQPHSS